MFQYEPVNSNPAAFIAIYKDTSSASKTTYLDEIEFDYDEGTPAKMEVRQAKWKHENYIARQPYSNSYPSPPRNAMYTDMRSTLPLGLNPLAHLDYFAPEEPIKARLEIKEYEQRRGAMGKSGWMGIWEEAQRTLKEEPVTEDINEIESPTPEDAHVSPEQETVARDRLEPESEAAGKAHDSLQQELDTQDRPEPASQATEKEHESLQQGSTSQDRLEPGSQATETVYDSFPQESTKQNRVETERQTTERRDQG